MSRDTASGETLLVVSGGEVIEVTTWHWTQRRAIARHWNAIEAAVGRGDEASLRRYRGRVVAGVELEADLDVIEAMAAGGPAAGYPCGGWDCPGSVSQPGQLCPDCEQGQGGCLYDDDYDDCEYLTPDDYDFP